MARREALVTIEAAGRDNGKTFKITELSAAAAEEFCYRLLSAMARTGTVVPENAFDAGMEGLAMIGLKALATLRWEDAKPLLDEMMACVTVAVPSQTGFTRRLEPTDIEEFATRLRLRDAWIELHTGFSVRAARSASTGIPSRPTEGNGAGGVISMSRLE